MDGMDVFFLREISEAKKRGKLWQLKWRSFFQSLGLREIYGNCSMLIPF